MKPWYDALARDWNARVLLIGLLSGLLLGGIVYWRTGAPLDAALAALAGGVLVIALVKSVQRRRARIRRLEETVEALREEIRQLKPAGEAAPQPEVPPAAMPARSTTSTERVIDALSDAAMTELSVWKRVWVWLVGGNTAVRVGVVVLFFGVAFLIKYAYENVRVLPIGARLIVVALGAVALLAIGWWLRTKRPAYGEALQGGGVGLLYLAVFGAAYGYNLLQGNAAFVLLAAVVAFAGYLAVKQNAQWIAILGIAGGFLAPVLLMNGDSSAVVLFGYYLLLNLAIFAIAFHKSWRSLNVLGLLFTFGVASVWGARFYLPQHFSSAEPFLILFFLLYVGIAVIHAWRQAPRFDDYVDSTIVFGAPLLAFALQIRLVRHFEHGAVWSAIAVSAFYLILAATLHRRHRETLGMLVEAFLALGLIFATITLPLALDGRWTAGLWALEGAAVYWVGRRQGKPLVRIGGLLLQLGAGVVLLADMRSGAIEQPVWNGFFWSCLFIAAAAGLICSRIMSRRAVDAGDVRMPASGALFLWGLAWWLLAGLHEISVHVAREDVLSAALLFFAGTCALCSLLWGRGRSTARFPALALAPLMAIVLVFQVIERPDGHPLAGLGAAAWPIAFLFHFRILRRHEDVYPRDLSYAHTLGMWLLAAVGTWEVAWQIGHLAKVSYPWPVVAWAVVPIALLALVAAIRSGWPVARYPDAYLWNGVKPLVAFLVLWMGYANMPSDTEPASPRYIPLLNPLDIAHVLAFGVVVYWWRAVQASGIDGPREFPATWPVTAWCVAVFLWANAVLLRTLRHYAGVPYQFQAVLESNLAQMWISILWAVLALATMFVGTLCRVRQMWIVGSVLMGAVVLKLLIIEFPRASAVESVVAIVTVGVLLLVLGYLAPVPPRQIEAA